MEKQKLLVIAAPTASGKSALALLCAEAFGGELISGDSMQIYKDMNIGTAKPSLEEQQRVRHHLIDVAEIHEAYSSGDFVEAAQAAITDITERGRLPILVGGSGMYLELVAGEAQLPEMGASEELREKLYEVARSEGVGKLHSMLREVDPESAEAIHQNNVKRVVRAIEVFSLTGVTMSEWKRRSERKGGRYEVFSVYLERERASLYEMINERVDHFVEAGLFEEARMLFEKGLETTPTASQAIGYKELFPFFKGEATKEECVELLKKNTRNLAKRQVTYFNRMKFGLRLACDGRTVEEAFSSLCEDRGFLDFIGKEKI